MGQESDHCLLDGSILGSLLRLQSRIQGVYKDSQGFQGLAGGHSHLSAGWTGAGGASSKMSPSRGHWQEASAPDHVELPQRLLEHPHNMAATLPQGKEPKQKTKKVLGPGPC